MIIALSLSAAILSLAMAFAWRVQQKTGKSGWIDAIWSYAVGLASVVAVLMPISDAPGRALLIAAMIGLWSARLGTHIALRTRTHGEDPRYGAKMAEWGPNASRELFIFLQIQALCGFVLILAIAASAQNAAPFPAITDFLALALLAGSVLGETIADAQLERFRKANAGRKAVCDVGLWAISRHPNYFFEWLGWCAYPLLSIGAGWVGFLSLLAPIMIYWLLVYASGIPLLEAQMVLSRGDAYKAYQKRVSAFFPWMPRKT
jgi:steroid 5-alpha reductase family enzyme